ncbi:hypothetical protein Abr02nite_59330 [Paractinoplanes brasiliensis]|nr:hypothetical protein Abr02nite_59330 [Actinoplanes brasiliensis]
MPALAVTTGGMDVDWVEVPISRWRAMRRPMQRLPLDPRSARRARRYIRFEPWSSMARLALLFAWATVNALNPFAVSRPIMLVAWLALFLWSIPPLGGALPRQTPYVTPAGDLRVPEVPIEVAKEWVRLNPGVVPTIEPLPRPRSRRWYATWSAVMLIVAVALLTVLTNDGREDSGIAWIGVLVLIFAGGATALKTLPPGYIRFEHSDS